MYFVQLFARRFYVGYMEMSEDSTWDIFLKIFFIYMRSPKRFDDIEIVEKFCVSNLNYFKIFSQIGLLKMTLKLRNTNI